MSAWWSKLPLGWRILIASGFMFGLFAVPVGVCGGALSADGLVWGLGSGMVAALKYGASMALVLGFMQVYRSSEGGRREMTLSVESRASLTIAAPPEAALDVARAELDRMGIARVIADDRACGVLEVKTSRTLWSWGSVIRVVAEATADGTTITLHSRPTLRTAMVDGGTNRKNVERLSAALNHAEGAGVEQNEPTPDAPIANRPPQQAAATSQRAAEHS